MTESVKWGKGREEQCRQWLDAELTAAIGARSALEAIWRKWLEQYRAPAVQPLKDFPFAGAANYVLPITATDVDQLYAKEMQTIFAPENLWTLQALNESWIDAAKPLQDGDRFDLELVFEKAGTRRVNVWVQTPRAGAPAHKH